jgi:hypothetical protein
MVMNERASGGFQEQELLSLEQFLGRVFQPVKPRNEFIQGLEKRLKSAPSTQVKSGGSFRSIFFILIGVIGGFILIAASIKATLSLIETLRILRTKY